MAVAVDQDQVAQVRAIWAAFARGGVEAVHQVAGDDVEWLPLGERMPSGLPDPGDSVSAVVHGFEAHGPCVLAHGSLRQFREGGFIDVQPSWVYYFDGAKLVRCVGYPTREQALAAIAEHLSRVA